MLMSPLFSKPRLALAVAAITGAITASLPAQITEWPTTVEPGRFLLEADVVSLTWDRTGSDRFTGWGVGSTFVSTGLTENWDVQLGVELFVSQEYESAGIRERYSGLGDMYVRTKWRICDDAERGFSAALLPYVKIPTNTGGVGNDFVEGGITLPWEVSLVGDWTLNAMADVSFYRNERDDGYSTYWFTSATVGRSLSRDWGAYAEVAIAKPAGSAPWETILGVGVNWHLTENFSWDFALYRGASHAAPDWHPVIRLVAGF